MLLIKNGSLFQRFPNLNFSYDIDKVRTTNIAIRKENRKLMKEIECYKILDTDYF